MPFKQFIKGLFNINNGPVMPVKPVKESPKKSMKIMVLTTGSEEKSARRLGFETATYWPFGKNPNEYIVIRAGNGYERAPIKDLIFAETNDFDRVINTQDSIILNVNKPKALKVLASVVNTPKVYNGIVPKGKYAVVRPKSHAGGAGFQLIKGPYAIPDGHYATEFVRTEKEIRIFCCGSKTITCSREKGKKTDSDICRSNWKYVRFRRSQKHLHKAALKASKALNLPICAFDILIKGRKHYFLEGNSCPTFENKATLFYKKNIPILVKKMFGKSG